MDLYDLKAGDTVIVTAARYDKSLFSISDPSWGSGDKHLVTRIGKTFFAVEINGVEQKFDNVYGRNALNSLSRAFIPSPETEAKMQRVDELILCQTLARGIENRINERDDDNRIVHMGSERLQKIWDLLQERD